jgi:hypothetical protein
VLSSAGPASAADFTVELPAGLACTFELRIEGTGGKQVVKEFLDKNGDIVRTLTAGTGSALTFTNVGTGASLALRSNGAVTEVTFNSDGSQTWISTGHNILILFPSDIPAGPTTTLYVGRLVFSVDSTGIFTLLGNSGQATDICAALS